MAASSDAVVRAQLAKLRRLCTQSAAAAAPQNIAAVSIHSIPVSIADVRRANPAVSPTVSTSSSSTRLALRHTRSPFKFPVFTTSTLTLSSNTACSTPPPGSSASFSTSSTIATASKPPIPNPAVTTSTQPFQPIQQPQQQPQQAPIANITNSQQKQLLHDTAPRVVAPRTCAPTSQLHTNVTRSKLVNENVATYDDAVFLVDEKPAPIGLLHTDDLRLSDELDMDDIMTMAENNNTNSSRRVDPPVNSSSSNMKKIDIQPARPPATRHLAPHQPPIQLQSMPDEQLEYSRFNLREYSYPWSRDVRKALVQVFKLNNFRQSQLNAINTTLNGRHCFVLMPTGGGKSLCYQLPAIIDSGQTRGVTVVVSPLLSLIKDQVDHLVHSYGIPAVAFTGDTGQELKRWIGNELMRSASPSIRIVYTTPEMLVDSRHFGDILQSLYDRGLFARFVVDEAHCVSTWGHDFRPKYKAIGPERQKFPEVPVLALTATANRSVRTDVISCLGIHDCVTFEQSFNRPNLRYEICPKTSNIYTDIANFIKTKYPTSTGIIYCLSQRDCEDMSAKLTQKGISVSYYHAGMAPEDKMRIQEQWAKGAIRVICATIAFGMGIDKADVRFVVHSSIPATLEGYYQETGRAGRDGKDSMCRLYYSYNDYKRHARMINKQTFEHENAQGVRRLRERLLEKLQQVVSYCDNMVDCRRKILLAHFSEEFDRAECHSTCDNCLKRSKPSSANSTSVMKNVTEEMCNLLEIVKKLEFDKVTQILCIKVFRGQKSKDILQRRWDSKCGGLYGSGRNMATGDAVRLMHLLQTEKLVEERYETLPQGFTVGYIHTTRLCEDFLKRKPAMQMAIEQRQTVPLPQQQQSNQKRQTTGGGLTAIGGGTSSSSSSSGRGGVGGGVSGKKRSAASLAAGASASKRARTGFLQSMPV